MSHSKRNTTRPVFTSHERNLAKSNWASKSARLGRDSFLPFGSCNLCLEIARDPVSCQRGDVFCRECALANMLSQKGDIKRLERARVRAELESARARAESDSEDQRRAVRDFESTQAGLDGNAGAEGDSQSRDETPHTSANTKRKFELDADELEKIAQADRTKARKAIKNENASKTSLPSFWTPSLTPDATKEAKLLEASKKIKPVAICPSSSADDAHSLTMQNLITIEFEEETDSSTATKNRICPSCRKRLTNSSSPVMSISCGHVLCSKCVDQFMVPAKQSVNDKKSVPARCFVCDKPLVTSDTKSSILSGVIKLKSEGTGFSARGGSTVESINVSFQC